MAPGRIGLEDVREKRESESVKARGRCWEEGELGRDAEVMC